MGRYLRKCRAMAAELALLDTPPPLTRSRSLSHLPPNPPPRPHPPKLRPRKPPSHKSSAARPSSPSPSSSSSSSSPNPPPPPPAADRIRTGPSEPPATCCSSNGSCELAVEVGESFEAARGLHSDAPSRSGTTGGEELDTAATSTPPPEPKRRRRGGGAARMPSAAEIEEFFAEAEKRERKRFADKYNFDVEKDIPLEGRYEWVRLIPEPLQQQQQQVQQPPL